MSWLIVQIVLNKLMENQFKNWLHFVLLATLAIVPLQLMKFILSLKFNVIKLKIVKNRLLGLIIVRVAKMVICMN
jgi:hypothetical protein